MKINFRILAFVKSGCHLTVNGKNDHMVQAEGMPAPVDCVPPGIPFPWDDYLQTHWTGHLQYGIDQDEKGSDSDEKDAASSSSDSSSSSSKVDKAADPAAEAAGSPAQDDMELEVLDSELAEPLCTIYLFFALHLLYE